MKNRFIMPVALGAILTVSGCGELPQGIETPLLKKTPAGPAQGRGRDRSRWASGLSVSGPFSFRETP